MAKTRTKTYTYTRIAAVKLQFKHTLLYASELDESYISLLLECIENQYLKSFSFYGMNKNDECEVELIININWSQFNVEVSVNDKIHLNSRTTKDGVSVIISDWTTAYLNIVNNRGLSMNIGWSYSDDVKNNSSLKQKVSSFLNSKPMDPIKYASDFKTHENFVVRDMHEMYGSLDF